MKPKLGLLRQQEILKCYEYEQYNEKEILQITNGVQTIPKCRRNKNMIDGDVTKNGAETSKMLLLKNKNDESFHAY